jgi:hypothetical protein
MYSAEEKVAVYSYDFFFCGALLWNENVVGDSSDILRK